MSPKNLIVSVERARKLATYLVATLLLGFLFVPTPRADAYVTVNLNNAPQAMGYGSGSTCPWDQTVYGTNNGFTNDVWHLVASQGNFIDAAGNLLGVNVTFNIPGIYRGIMTDTTKPAQAWVYTLHQANVTPSITGGTAILTDGGTKFVLSHTCIGLTSNTLLTTPTSNQKLYPSTSPSTLTTQVSSTSFVLGGAVSDLATINIGSGTTAPTGQVSFYYCFNASAPVTSCTSTANFVSTVTSPFTSTGGGNYTIGSGNFIPSQAGYYAFYAVYGGDGNYTGSAGAITNEQFQVTSPPTRASPTIATTASTTLLKVGGSLYDTATVTGVGSTAPTGTVTFYYCYSGSPITSCSGLSKAQIGTAQTLPASAPFTVVSPSFTPPQAGYYVFNAVYSGDSNYLSASDSGTNEAFQVTPLISTSVTTTSANSSINLGSSVTDTARITLATSSTPTPTAPTGTVRFYYCYSTSAISSCSSTANLIGSSSVFTVAETNTAYTVVSPNFVPANAGNYAFYAVYSGDSNYSGSADTSIVNETFTVIAGDSRASSSVTTTPTVTSVGLGGSIRDVATISPSSATGTVTFSYCYSDTITTLTTSCTAGTQIGAPVTVSGGSATSPSFTPTQVGYYIFHAVYSGDTSVKPSYDSGAGETFSVVALPSPVITTVAQKNNLLVGQSITDTAYINVSGLVAGTPAPTGRVTFYYCYNASSVIGTCNASSTLTSLGYTTSITLDSGSTYKATSSAFYPTNTGYYAFYAVYSGDSNYSSIGDASVTNETFTVFPTSGTVSITTTPSKSTLSLGSTLVDVATVVGDGVHVPTGTVTFSYCSSASPISSCASGTQIGAPVTLSATAPYIATSPTFKPLTVAPYYIFRAVYSGDSYYASKADSGAGETFTVTALPTPTVTTRASTNNILLGETLNDSATISTGSDTTEPTGSVSFYYCSYTNGLSAASCGSAATLFAVVSSPFTKTGTYQYQVNSGTFLPPAEGNFAFHAVYSGDSHYSTAAETSLTNETYTVSPTVGTATISTSRSSSSIAIGNSLTDVATVVGDGIHAPTGTVTFYYCSSNSAYVVPCTSGTQVGTPVTLSATAPYTATSAPFTPSTVGYFYTFGAVYSGDSYYTSDSDDGLNETFTVVNLTAPTLTTTASSTSAVLGSYLTDTATLTTGGDATAPTGSVAFYYCYDPSTTVTSCTSTSNYIGSSTLGLVSGSYIAVSPSFYPTSIGYYAFYAVYSGDSHYASIGEASLANEIFRVVPSIGTPTVTSLRSSTSVTVGNTLTDTASITGDGVHTPTGTVTFYYCYSASSYDWVAHPCSVTGTDTSSATQFGSPVSVSAGSATSSAFTPANVGYYSFLAVYSGDSYYNSATDDGNNENFQAVAKKTTSIITRASAFSLNTGSSLYDTATITLESNVATPTGTVSFYYCYDANATVTSCYTTTNFFGSTTTLTGSSTTFTAISPSFTPPLAGYYAFYAVYSGDSNYSGSADNSLTNETFTVTAFALETTSITTTRGATTSFTLGGSITDTATITPSSVTGTVTFSYCYHSTNYVASCSGGTQIGAPVTVSGGIAVSPIFTPTLAGKYTLHAVYSGDTKYATSYDNGVNETFTVTALDTTTISTTASASSLTLGGNLYDTATINTGSNSNAPTGTVSFYVCTDTSTVGNCGTSKTLIGTSSTFTSVSGANPYTWRVVSPAYYPSATGTFAFYAIYSGDTRYSGSEETSLTNETFTVTATTLPTPTITTGRSAATITLGSTITDTVTVTGSSGTPTGTVTFYYCSSASSITSCSGLTKTQIGSPVTLVSGSATSPTFKPTVANYYVFNAVYSGDATYASATDSGGTSESFRVNAPTSVSTTISTSAGTVSVSAGANLTKLELGDTINDVATVTLASNSGAATGTVSFYYCSYSAVAPATTIAQCKANMTLFSTVSISGSGTTYTATSATFTPPAIGTFAFFASYSGNETYTASEATAFTNEIFTVVPVKATGGNTPVVSTTVSSTTPTINSNVTETITITGSGSLSGTIVTSYCYSLTAFAAGFTCDLGIVYGSKITFSSLTSPIVKTATFTPTKVGYYMLHAAYNGDNNTAAAVDSGANESFQVSAGNTTTLSTVASKTSLTLGASLWDSATLTLSTGGTPVGNVKFYYCYNPSTEITTCDGSSSLTLISTKYDTDTPNPFVQGADTSHYTINSGMFTPSSAGKYAFYAVYSGGGDYQGSSGSITGETFTVNAPGQTSSSITTTRGGTTSFVLGGSITDTATVTGSGSTPTGTVTFSYCYDTSTFVASCNNGTQIGAPVTLSGGVAVSPTFTPTLAGKYTLHAVYSGNSSYLTSYDDGTNETFTVTALDTTTISTTASSSNVTLGSSLYDTATINTGTKSTAPTGTVSFYVCTDTSTVAYCSSSKTLVGTSSTFTAVSVSSPYTWRVVSPNYYPTSVGNYAFYAVYSGDSNYSGSEETSLSGETFTVAPTFGTATVSTTPSRATMNLSQNIYDTAVVTGDGVRVPTGTVTFYYCYSASSYTWTGANTCSLTGTGARLATQIGSAVTLGGTSPYTAVSSAFTPPSAPTNGTGYYTFLAIYSGDSYYASATDTGAGESFTVTGPKSTSLVTQDSTGLVTIGGSLSDTATITVSAYNTAAPTGTVKFYYCYNSSAPVGSCASTTNLITTISSPFTATSATVYTVNSGLFTPPTTGYYAFYAVYSGDSFYAGSADASITNETFTVVAKPIKSASITTTTRGSNTSITIGRSLTDTATVTGSGVTPTGSIKFTYCYSSVSFAAITTPCTGGTQIGSQVTLNGSGVAVSSTFTPTNIGYYIFNAAYSGDSNYESSTDTGINETFTVTALPATTLTTQSSKTSLTIGNNLSDVATLTLPTESTETPTGTIKFYYCYDSTNPVTTCSSTSNLISTVSSPFTKVDGTHFTASSGTFIPPSVGKYSFAAVYSGDLNYAGSVETSTLNETFTVNALFVRTTPTLATHAGTNPTIGESIFDTATMTGTAGRATPTGTITFSYCYSATSFAAIASPCSSGTQIGAPVSLSSGVAVSPEFVPSAVGYYIFHAVYSGDSNYISVADNGTNETFTVLDLPSTTLLTQSSKTSLTLGESLTDSATIVLPSAGDSPTGTISFYYCSNASTMPTSCTAAAGSLFSVISSPFTKIDDTHYVAISDLFIPSAVGKYSFGAVYSGDLNYYGSVDSNTVNETFTVNPPFTRDTATVVTTAGTSPIYVNHGITDTATVTGAGATPTGTVTFSYCYDTSTYVASCTSGIQIGAPVTLSGGVAVSPTFIPTVAGKYTFHAVYSGDSDYLSAFDSGSGETFTVENLPSTSIATTVSSDEFDVGGSVYDTATITFSGGTTPTGTVSFYYCYGGAAYVVPCTNTTNLVGTEDVVALPGGGYGAISPLFYPSNPGFYTFYAVYSGDSDYAGSAETDATYENFRVHTALARAPSIITTKASSSEFRLGNSVYDTATVTGTTFTLSGTVTFTYCYSATAITTCAGLTETQTGAVIELPGLATIETVTSNAFTPTLPGYYVFHAMYSGNSQYESAYDESGSLEAFHVLPKVASSVTTQRSLSSLTVGNIVSDTATITIASAGDTPTGTTTFYYCYDAATPIASCDSTLNPVSIVTGPYIKVDATHYTVNSGSFIPADVGYYAFYAVYSGDANYSGSADLSIVNETFTVTPNRGPSTVTTQASVSSIRYGQTAYDVATVVGDGIHVPSGMVTFSYCYSASGYVASCTSGTQIGSPVAVSATAPYIATSPIFTPSNVGYYTFRATYSGDSFYYSSGDAGGVTEQFQVRPKTTTSLTTLTTETVTIGSSTSDTATINTGSETTTPTGTVKFYYCFNATSPITSCTSTSNLATTVNGPFTDTSSATLFVVNSGPFIPPLKGYYAFHAVYSGDTNYSGSTEVGVANETFQVIGTDTRETPTVTTRASLTSIIFGESITDSVTVTGNGITIPTGTVTFSYCYSSVSAAAVANPCNSGTQIGLPVTLSETGTATSPAFTPVLGGYYIFHAVYNGDSNYRTAADGGAYETFTVSTTSPTTLTTTASNDSITVGDIETDTAILDIGGKTTTPTGNVKFYYCFDAINPLAACTSTSNLIGTVYSPFTYVSTGKYSIVSPNFKPARAGNYAFYAVYSGDGSYGSSADISISGETFTVAEAPIARTAASISTKTSKTTLVYGQSLYDSATVSPVGATGTVTFSYCYSASGFVNPCAGGTQIGYPVNLETGTARSQLFVPTQVGYYTFHASYSGDANYLAAEDTGINETFTVTANATTLTTKVASTTLTLGQSMSDVATLNIGAGPTDPTGSVKFYYCYNVSSSPTCATGGTIFDTVTTFTVNADGTTYSVTSKAFTPTDIGYYTFHAVYSGDSTYLPSEDSGANESFNVLGNLTPTVATTASQTSFNIGGSLTDSVTVTGVAGKPTPTGTVTFFYCYSTSPISTCSSGTQFGTAIALVSGSATSSVFTPTKAGYYMFDAIYSGDSYYKSASDNGVNETFTVIGKPTSVTTVVTSPSITLGSSVYDRASINIGTGTIAPTGTVNFYYCYSTDTTTAMPACTSTANPVGASTAFIFTSGSIYSVSSPAFTPSSGGQYNFYAVYSGDANYAGSSDLTGTNERFIVQGSMTRQTPQVTTSASKSLLTLGQSLTDVATVTVPAGQPAPTGTITFYYCFDELFPVTTCNLTTSPTLVGPAKNLGASAPYSVISPTFTPTRIGFYKFWAVYSGNTNYTDASDNSGSLEQFQVKSTDPTTLTTEAALSTFALGITTRDVATLDVGVGTAAPTGSVTFYYCFNATTAINSCSSTANRIGSSSTFNYQGGSLYTITSPDFTPTAEGNYVFYAVYSGDLNYASSADSDSTNEIFKVTPADIRASSVIVTTASAKTLTVGQSLTDSATVTVIGTSKPTGTVTFYYCHSRSLINTCLMTNATQIGDPVALDTTGTVQSPEFTPFEGGYYIFHAVYSGDVNFASAEDSSFTAEAFTVQSLSTSITTRASATSIALGSEITDVATVDVGVGLATPTGNVTFYYCYNASTPITSCVSTANRIGSSTTFVHTVGSQYTVVSPAFIPVNLGYYAFFAVYSGDSSYTSSSEISVAGETFQVVDAATIRADATVSTVASSANISLSQSVSDHAVITTTGDSSTLTGQVTFYYCYNPTSEVMACNASIGTQFSDPIPLGALTTVIISPEFTPTLEGYYAFHAVYSGDASNSAALDPSGTSEKFLVGAGYVPPTPPPSGILPPSIPPVNPPARIDTTTPTTVDTSTPTTPTTPSTPTTPTTPTTPVDETSTPTTKPSSGNTFNIRQGDVPSMVLTGMKFDEQTQTSTRKKKLAAIAAAQKRAAAIAAAKKKAAAKKLAATLKKMTPAQRKAYLKKIAAAKAKIAAQVAAAAKKSLAQSRTKKPSSTTLPSGYYGCTRAEHANGAVGAVQFLSPWVKIIPVDYPAGGTFAPPAYTDVASISKRHQPIGAIEGATVIAWHIDVNNCVGTLDPLGNSHVGDNLSIIDENLVTHTLSVSQVLDVPIGEYRREWFRLNGKRIFVFITCSGEFVNGHYTHNRVVIAVPNEQ